MSLGKVLHVHRNKFQLDYSDLPLGERFSKTEIEPLLEYMEEVLQANGLSFTYHQTHDGNLHTSLLYSGSIYKLDKIMTFNIWIHKTNGNFILSTDSKLPVDSISGNVSIANPSVFENYIADLLYHFLHQLSLSK